MNDELGKAAMGSTRREVFVECNALVSDAVSSLIDATRSIDAAKRVAHRFTIGDIAVYDERLDSVQAKLAEVGAELGTLMVKMLSELIQGQKDTDDPTNQ